MPDTRLTGIARFAALALAVTVVAGCGSSSPKSTGGPSPSGSGSSQASPAFPVTINGSAGPVTLTSKPTSIVSLSPTATEMLFAIGAGGQVIAADKYSTYPAQAPRKNLDGFQLNVEAITAYKPDLVIVQDPSAAAKKLSTLGIAVLSEPAVPTLDKEYEQFVQLGNATGHTSEANQLVAQLKSQVSSIVSGAHKPSRPLTYYYELDPTYYSETSNTFVGELFKLLGLTSIADSAKGAAGGNGSPQLNSEFIVKANPDYIFLADTVCCQQSASTVSSRPGWATMAAVKQGRIVALNDDIASRWGPRVVVLLRAIADELNAHPVSAGS